MKRLIFLVFVIYNILLVPSFAEDRTSYNCEVFVDKMVPVKVYFHNKNTTYSLIDFYLKVRSDLVSEIESANFHAQKTIFHAYGKTPKLWQAYSFTKIAKDYYKLSLEVALQNHSVSKYSNITSSIGNFYIKLKSGLKIWTHNYYNNIKVDDATLGYIPVDIKWLNDGQYNLDEIPSTSELKTGYMSRFNLEGCR